MKIFCNAKIEVELKHFLAIVKSKVASLPERILFALLERMSEILRKTKHAMCLLFYHDFSSDDLEKSLF